jgi:hypothetical protein
MKIRLTMRQRATLDTAAHNNGAFFAHRSDKVLCALERKKLMRWSSGRKYRVAYWVLTVAGWKVAL